MRKLTTVFMETNRAPHIKSKCLKKRFGEVEGITDKDYVTNSYHVPVFEEINPFVSFRKRVSRVVRWSNIYIEASDLTNNTDAIIQVIKHIYENIICRDKHEV